MRKIIPTLFLLIAFFSMPVLAEGQKYTCPMHPHYIADRPGSCPICGMDLVALEAEDESAAEDVANDSVSDSASASGEKKVLYWQAPMNPNYRSDKPGKSPMGMDLVPVYGEARENTKKDYTARTVVTIAPETIQNTGVRTEKAQMASFGTAVRSYGDVTENVRLQTDIAGRVSGWVKDLRFKAEGDEVKKGELLFTLDSPELISAQQDYISALKTGVTGRINAGERRLSSLGIQNSAITTIRKNRKAETYMPFYAESDGVISMISIREGTYVKPGMMVMQIQDYSSVWVEVSIAEQDIPYIDDTTKVTVSFPNLGIQEKPAKIDYIYPTIDRATRTGRVRLVLDSPDNVLKPGAYADVEFQTGVERRLSIPSDAILKSKDGDFVVVALNAGRFQPRRILAGLRYRGRTEVLKGLAENDNVVVSGQFLIDSESSLRESFRKMQRMQTSLNTLEVGDDQMAMIDHLADAALYIHEELIAERTPNPKMIMPAITIGDHLMPVFRGTKLQFVLEDAEDALMKAKDSLTDVEWRESLNELVTALKPWLLEGRPQHYKDKGLKLYMAHGLDTYWLQLGEDVQNPYGEGHPMKIDWLSENKIQMPDTAQIPQEPIAGGAHGGH
tara:strand:- start:16249 stop:18099 length:1851 start_codon:yes stop_codon:yes gene_type:complete